MTLSELSEVYCNLFLVESISHIVTRLQVAGAKTRKSVLSLRIVHQSDTQVGCQKVNSCFRHIVPELC